MGRSAASDPGRRGELTAKQREVLALIERGFTNAEIARELAISLDGAKWHVREVLARLDVDTREEAAEWWRRNGRSGRTRCVVGKAFGGIGWRWLAGGAAALTIGGTALVAYAALSGDTQSTAIGIGNAVTPAAPARPSTVTAIPNITVAPNAAALPTTPRPDPRLIGDFPARGVAFIRDGNLWVKTLPAPGTEYQVTVGGGMSSPRWSSSGSYLAVKAVDTWWVISTSGTVVRLGVAFNVAWSPAEDILALETPGTLTVFRAGSGSPAHVAPLSDSEGLAWSPDGSRIAVGGGQGIEHAASPPIHLFDADGSPTGTVAAGSVLGTETIPMGWSGDGKAVLAWVNPFLSLSARANGSGLYAFFLDGSAPADVGFTLGYEDVVAAKPGTNEVAVALGGGRMAWAGGPPALAILPATAGAWPGADGQAAAALSWSPDGATLAYSAAPSGGKDVSGGDAAKALLMQRRLWLTAGDGSPPRQLTNDPRYRDEYPRWLGGSILFTRSTPDKVSLWLMDPANPGSAAEYVGKLDWPPDPPSGWFGYYGHVEWSEVVDAWAADYPTSVR